MYEKKRRKTEERIETSLLQLMKEQTFELQSTPTAQTQFQSVGRVFLVIGTGGHGRWSVSGMGGVLRRARPSGKASGPGAVGKAVSWWRQSDSLAYVLDGVDGGECSTAMTSVLSSSVRLLTASLSR